MLSHILITIYAIVGPGLMPVGAVMIPVDDMSTCQAWTADEINQIVVSIPGGTIDYKCVDQPTSEIVESKPAKPAKPTKPAEKQA